ncbi:hypothetical protein ITP53_43755 [Nonomuraea sp. K274]|uniref:YCII-related domain-containing protein n=1 Tax=Nonomuraea cypriaca TaxID=1187855 RepID=A0A931AL00_9ACTN|nr:YciI family protein [Nonomuraea cypriaca]MBF8192483.1 hypothetical protein [Nonomuraea cypriaca]
MRASQDNAVVLHVLLVRYTGRPEDADPHVAGHVAFLERHHAGGTFLLSGQTVPASVGGVILATGSRERIEQVAAGDPFVTAGVATYEIVTVTPGRFHEDLADLLTVAEAGAEPFRVRANEPVPVRNTYQSWFPCVTPVAA